MPSPVRKTRSGVYYRRKDGAWIRVGKTFKRVGAKKYRHRVHYSKHLTKQDRKRHAKKGKEVKKYSQVYD